MHYFIKISFVGSIVECVSRSFTLHCTVLFIAFPTLTRYNFYFSPFKPIHFIKICQLLKETLKLWKRNSHNSKIRKSAPHFSVNVLFALQINTILTVYSQYLTFIRFIHQILKYIFLMSISELLNYVSLILHVINHKHSTDLKTSTSYHLLRILMRRKKSRSDPLQEYLYILCNNEKKINSFVKTK